MHAVLDMTRARPGIAPSLDAALDQVEARFREHLTPDLVPTDALCEHIERYRGKMLRPALVVLSGMATGADPGEIGEAHIVVAAVIEMIHMATLVHDDVLDEASMRRGSPTVNARFGLDAAVTLGDFLFARSFHLCSTLRSQQTSVRIGEVTARVCEGEILQNSCAGRFDLRESTYFDIIERKTAALIAVACELGAIHSGAGDEASRRMGEFGRRIGIAFQIQDDLLDLVGEEQVVGKSLGTDLRKGKLTLPLIHHLATVRDETTRAAAVERLSGAASGESVVELLESTGSIAYARGIASSLVGEGKALLGPLAQTPARESLLDLATAVVTREF